MIIYYDVMTQAVIHAITHHSHGSAHSDSVYIIGDPDPEFAYTQKRDNTKHPKLKYPVAAHIYLPNMLDHMGHIGQIIYGTENSCATSTRKV